MRSLLRHTAVLRGYEPTRVKSSRQAFEQFEQRFSRVLGFAFTSTDRNEVTSSGPSLQGWSVVLVRSTGHRIDLGDDDKISILFPYCGLIGVGRAHEAVEAGPDEMIIAAPGRRTTELSSNYLGVLIQIPMQGLARLAAGGLDPPLPTLQRLAPASAALMNARQVVEKLENGSERPDCAEHLASLVMPLWDELSEALQSPGAAPPPACSLRQVRNAQDYMRAHFHRPLSVSEVARACDVGARALQVAFRRHRRSSPMQFLHEVRLHQARARLEREGGETSVTKVALDCGFSHFGRFSVDYRSAFGERPSATRKRSAMAPAPDRPSRPGEACGAPPAADGRDPARGRLTRRA